MTLYIGVDIHARQQTVSYLDSSDGTPGQVVLDHERDVREFNSQFEGEVLISIEFLSSANPKNWPQSEMRSMMHDHLNLTTKEAVARLHGDWAAAIAAYDAVQNQILQMADGLTMGIVNQFPDKFK